MARFLLHCGKGFSSTRIPTLLRSSSRAGAILALLLAGTILWRWGIANANAPEGPLAYRARMITWRMVSLSALLGNPPLCVFTPDRLPPLKPIEAAMTDDMGMPLLVDLLTRVVQRPLGPHAFLALTVGINLAALATLYWAIGPSPVMRWVSVFIPFLPSFLVPARMIGPDLFGVYAMLSLAGVSVVLLSLFGRQPVRALTAGLVLGAIFLLRQAIGMMGLAVLGLAFLTRLLSGRSRAREALRSFLCTVAMFVASLGAFQGLLALRNAHLPAGPSRESLPTGHTVFHALYVGIGNIPDNPWKIVYDDRFGYEKVYGKYEGSTTIITRDYGRAIRREYFRLWTTDGFRLASCYLRHFFHTVKSTLGLPSLGLALGCLVLTLHHLVRQRPVSLLLGTLFALSAFIFAFLVQSTLIDGSFAFSHPTRVLGRFLWAFALLGLFQLLFFRRPLPT